MFLFLGGNLCCSVAWKICFTGQTWNYFELEVVETPLFCQIRRQTLYSRYILLRILKTVNIEKLMIYMRRKLLSVGFMDVFETL